MTNSNLSSPAHFGLAGTFSPEDIQELLGAMVSEPPILSGGETTDGAVATTDMFDDSFDINNDNDNNDNDNNTTTKVAKVQERSERKRSREKQRRSDVNKQFADLTTLLGQLEAEESEDDRVARLPFSPSNRVDLIARTIVHLERLRELNKRRKGEVESLQQQLEQAKKAGEDTAAKLKEVMFNQAPPNKQVMMMVPMMVSADGTPTMATGTTPPTTMPMINPFMMPQPYMTPQVPQATQQQQPQRAQPYTMPPMPSVPLPTYPGFAMPNAMSSSSATPSSQTTPMMTRNPTVATMPHAPAPAPSNTVASTTTTTTTNTPYGSGSMLSQHVPLAPNPLFGFSYPMPPPSVGTSYPVPTTTTTTTTNTNNTSAATEPPHTTHTTTTESRASTTTTTPTTTTTSTTLSSSEEQKTASSPRINEGSNLAHCA